MAIFRFELTTPEFQAVQDGNKCVDIRHTSEGIGLNDLLELADQLTSRLVYCLVTHIVVGPAPGVRDNWSVFSFRVIEKTA